MNQLPVIAISLGDPNGVGPEVVLKALQDEALLRRARFILVGSEAVLRAHAERMDIKPPFSRVPDGYADAGDERAVMLDVAPDEKHEVAYGKATAAGGRQAMQAFERALDLCISGEADALVTAPISKGALALAGYTRRGHTDFIVERTGARSHVMMMAAGPLRVGLATAHVALAEVPSLLTSDLIVEKLRVIHESLQRDFGIAEPRLAVLGLNPHAGDGGVMGDEEARVIQPAMTDSAQARISVAGPFPADAYFANDGYKRHHAVLAMYHDQGLAPFKALAFEQGVNFTAGLPIVRTSPDHGTAYDIAGEGLASHVSMASAIRLAIDVLRERETAGGRPGSQGAVRS